MFECSGTQWQDGVHDRFLIEPPVVYQADYIENAGNRFIQDVNRIADSRDLPLCPMLLGALQHCAE
ncbi:hypothetical protein C1I99_13510 [Micromonospora deserti]|uniref:Uncharacterized protein n=1 Tax=Micromonospora deserti TaxID=2070366 RepID=A0A2W2DEY8_9ACTN|nr:hypothetical protein C1I99_13510 [Micromonospora deserti]